MLSAILIAAAAVVAAPPQESEPRLREELRVEVVEAWPFRVEGDACDALGADDVTVREGGEEARVVAVRGSRPAAIHTLLLDTSLSMFHPERRSSRKKARRAKAAAHAYLSWLHEESEAGQTVALLTFDDRLAFPGGVLPASDVAAIADGHRVVDGLVGGEQTFLHDAVWRTVDYLDGSGARAVLIVLSDGEDTGGGRSADAALRRVDAANEVTVFTVGVGPSEPAHTEFLRALARRSGGAYFNVPERDPALERRFLEIRERLRSERYVSYRPPARSAEEAAEIDVRIESVRPGCRVATDGYRPRRAAGRAEEREALPPRGERDGRLLRITLNDAVREGGLLRREVIRRERAVELFVPPFAAATSAPETPAEALDAAVLGLMDRGGLPSVRTDRDRHPGPLPGEINGTTFLESRASLAAGIASEFPTYADWVRTRLADAAREQLVARSSVRRDAATLEALVRLRSEHPLPAERARHLVEWHGDRTAAQVAAGIERRLIERLVVHPGDPSLARAEGAWPALYDWLRPPARVHVTVPLFLTYDVRRNVFGLTRIVTALRPWSPGGVPERPYALDAARRLLALAPGIFPSERPVSVEVTRLPEDRDLDVPIARHRIRFVFGESEVVLVAEARYPLPAGWDGTAPDRWYHVTGRLGTPRTRITCVRADREVEGLETCASD